MQETSNKFVRGFFMAHFCFMKKVLLLSFILAFGYQAKSQCVDPSLINPFAICPMIWMPVCGCDGVTYANAKVARENYGVKNYTPGKCDKKDNEPVDTNSCYDESLITNEPIIAIYDPVCGCDGITYSSSMEATTRYGVKKYTQGPCKKLWICPVGTEEFKKNNDSTIFVD